MRTGRDERFLLLVLAVLVTAGTGALLLFSVVVVSAEMSSDVPDPLPENWRKAQGVVALASWVAACAGTAVAGSNLSAGKHTRASVLCLALAVVLAVAWVVVVDTAP